MVTYIHRDGPTLRLWLALATTFFAGVVTVLASLNLYLLEDDNALTPIAYSASPLLRLSYDGVYLSALVVAVALCTLLSYLLVRHIRSVIAILVIVSLLVALLGFGGLLLRQPLAFLGLALAFTILTLLSAFAGRAVRLRSQRTHGSRVGALLGGCVSAVCVLLVNLATLASHTLALNPVSHLLYMQGQIGNTHFNSLLVALAGEFLSVLLCTLTILLALRPARRSS